MSTTLVLIAIIGIAAFFVYCLVERHVMSRPLDIAVSIDATLSSILLEPEEDPRIEEARRFLESKRGQLAAIYEDRLAKADDNTSLKDLDQISRAAQRQFITIANLRYGEHCTRVATLRAGYDLLL